MFSGTGNDAGYRRIYRNANHLTSSGRTAPVAAGIPACPMNAQNQVQQEQQSMQQQQREALARAAVPGPGRGSPVV